MHMKKTQSMADLVFDKKDVLPMSRILLLIWQKLLTLVQLLYSTTVCDVERNNYGFKFSLLYNVLLLKSA